MDLPPLFGRDETNEERSREVEGREWRVDVTNADVRTAKEQWLAAYEGGGPTSLIDLLYQDYVHLISAQAQQLADELRHRHPL